MLVSQSQRGDTIIEVLFAVAVFSLLAVMAIAIMNQGVATSQRALEITQVRNQIDAQAEALRYVHNSYLSSFSEDATGSGWDELKAKAIPTVTPFGSNTSTLCPDIPNTGFIMNARTGSVVSTTLRKTSEDGSPIYAQVRYDLNVVRDVYGMWIEAARDEGAGGIGFIDFHIRACWEGPGNAPPVTMGTIVRLYDPAV